MQQVLMLLLMVFLLHGANANPNLDFPPLEFGTDETLDEDDIEEIPSTHVPHLMSTETAVEATVGETVRFPCDVDDIGDYVLLWKHKNTNILFAGDLRVIRDDRIRVDGTTLVVRSVQPKDSGEFACQISTTPPIELVHSLDVLYPPTVSVQPKTAFITAKEGERVTLRCDATGNPMPTMTWKHAGRHYDSFEEGTFVINNAQKNDSGEYECIADNSVGNPATSVITVEIVSAPKIVPEPKSGLLVVKEGEPITIACRASGDPVPTISWKKPNTDRMMKMHVGEKIMIEEATQRHAGTYECIANNSLGISTSAMIRVQVLYVPKVQMSHSRIHAHEGASVNITCRAEGEPAPTVTWKKEGAVIHSNEHHHLKVHGHAHTLLIRHLREQDFGIYECMASNSLSSATASTHLLGTPQVSSFTSKPHGSQGTKYTLSWTVSTLTPIDEFSLMYRKSGEEEWESKSIPAELKGEDDLHTQMFQLMDLEPSTEYEAIVKARNKFGWSEQSEALVFTTKNEDKQMESYASASSAISYGLSTVFILASLSQFWH